MKRLLVAMVLGSVVVALPAAAVDDTAKKVAAKPVASPKLSLDPNKGQFHQVHTQKLKASCDTCHATELKDVLFLRGSEVPRGPGPVDRATCLNCHQVSAKPAWYGATR
jgi:hypothetical protein